MSSTAARRVAQLNAHLTDAPVDQIQRFPTAAVRSRPDPPRAPMRRNNARRPKSPRLQASALPRQHAPTHTDDPTPSHQHHATQRKSPDDIVVVSALRTPITRAKKGGLKDTPADDLVATLLKATVDRTGLDVSDVGDVVVGSVLGNSSQRANECRIAMFLAGFPQEVPVRTVNRQCSSGLQACADVAGEYFFVLYLFAYTNFFVLQPPSKLGTTRWASPPAWRR